MEFEHIWEEHAKRSLSLLQISVQQFKELEILTKHYKARAQKAEAELKRIKEQGAYGTV